MDILVWILGIAVFYFLIGLMVAWAKAATVGGFEWGFLYARTNRR